MFRFYLCAFFLCFLSQATAMCYPDSAQENYLMGEKRVMVWALVFVGLTGGNFDIEYQGLVFQLLGPVF